MHEHAPQQTTSAQSRTIQLEPSWLAHLEPEFDKPYMEDLRNFLLQEKRAGKTIFPPGNEIFNAFTETPFDKVKVVILGQDPYHGPGQAHGLSFSVKPGVQPPPSLVNIYKELESDLGIPTPKGGTLTPWCHQGVLLINSILTVEAHKAASHHGRGWETFTDRVIELVADKLEDVVFILWGSYAAKKGAAIDSQKHCIIKSPHPSPLSAHRGFFGSKPFSRANQFLLSRGKEPVDWRL